MQQVSVHIILVNDNDKDRNSFTKALEELKIKTLVDIFEDRKQLMDYLNNDKISLPHLIFIDSDMPLKQGVECLQGIRNNIRFKDVVLAIYSNSPFGKDVEDAMVIGANVYLRKPDNYAALKKVLTEVMTLYWQYNTSGFNKEMFICTIN